MTTKRQILIEGLTPDEVLELTDEELDGLVFTGSPIVFHAGTAQILGEFRLSESLLTVELAQIDGGGEGVLPALWMLTERYALLHGLSGVEWIVHAINCAEPNAKLRRVLLKRGFQIRSLPNVGEAYYLFHPVKPQETG